jgi:hypothetical protein
MYKLSSRLIIVLLTFVIGISSATGWYYYQESQKTQIILPNASWESLYFNGRIKNGTSEEKSGGINQATKLAGLTELRKTRVKEGDIEVRVWRGFGLSPLEAVILSRTNNQWSAKHLKTDHYYDYEKVESKQLNPPKSGWESFWKQIDDKEILTLRDSSEINCGEGGMDGGSYVVEINQNKTYRTYKLSTAYSGGKCREANQMEGIGDIIGEEFDCGIEQCQEAEWFACTRARKSNKK